MTFADEVEARPILRECAISYAVTESGRPIGTGEDAFAPGDRARAGKVPPPTRDETLYDL